MVLSTILTNRVNKKLRTVMPRHKKPAICNAGFFQFSGLRQLAAGTHIVRPQPAGFEILIFGQIQRPAQPFLNGIAISEIMRPALVKDTMPFFPE